MAEKPQAPEWMMGEARPAFSRIVDHLWARGEWRPEYWPMAELAAMTAAVYLRSVRQGAAAQEIEEARVAARKCLAAMCWLPENRAHLGVVNADGSDGELMAVCAPLAEA